MNDKRDEVIDAATDCLVKRKMKNLNTKYFSVSTEEMADFAIQHALSREAELRRNCADELSRTIGLCSADPVFIFDAMTQLAEKWRCKQ